MKKTLAILCLLCLAMTRTAAYEWTDTNGVTWTFSSSSFTINSTSQQLWYISGASGYGENVTVPATVYNGSTAYTVEAVNLDSNNWFPSGTTVTLPSTIKYIGGLFRSNASGSIKLNATTPPKYSIRGGKSVTVLVPAASLNTYKAADGWKDIAMNIISQSAKTTYSINTTAQASSSGIHQVIGEDDLINVMSLTVKGSINSYDIMIMRNKMHNLQHLDLTNASIVANSYTYYDKYYTTDNVLGDYAFYNMSKLISVKLPENITAVGQSAFRNCSGLISVKLPNSLKEVKGSTFSGCYSLTSSISLPACQTIGDNAFSSCYALTSISLPACQTIGGSAFSTCNALTSISLPACQTIGDNAFSDCDELTSISLPACQTIGDNAFRYCNDLTSISLPACQTIGYQAFYDCDALTSISLPACQTIGGSAFLSCDALTEVHIPSSIRSIGGSAFAICPKLKDYYAYTIEPTTIAESTFSNWTTATLHIPMHAYNNYYWDTQWSKFYRLVQDNNYQYDYFYLTQDYVFDDNVGAMNSTPNVQLDGGSGLIVQTTQSTVKFDEVHMADNGSATASIIADNNLTVESLYFDMAVTKNKWYFLSFPFRVKLSNVTSPGNFVFRYYDGQTRAQSGKGGWKNVTSTYLNAHQGYIFQTNETGTLTLKVEKSDMNFNGGERQDALTSYASSTATNASWNFIGNPHSSYFDIDNTGYSAPITVWNGSTYQALRAGDDQYHLSPFQAFFVQKPEGTSAMRFPASGRHTFKQWADRVAAKSRRTSADRQRSIINLAIGNGNAVEDQTRVVFNSSKSTAYEMDCDASKFLTDQPVAQLYTVDAEGTQYAINERPLGEVVIGYVATTAGELTISAVRMDQHVYLRDNELGIIHDLSLGGYTFSADAGVNESRFTLVTGHTETGIIGVDDTKPDGNNTTYDLQGRRIEGAATHRGVYIVKKGQKATKVIGQ